MYIINGILIGIIATLIFDIFQNSLLYAYNINKPKWYLVGRFFYHFKNKIFFHDDIESENEIKNELILGYFFHYIVGAIYGLIYIILNILFFNHPSFLLAITIGFITVLGNWCIMMPYAFNIGFFASKKEERFQILTQNLIAHFIFGVGLFTGYILIN